MAAAYRIEYAAEAVNDLRAIRAFDRARVVHSIELHLRHEPVRSSSSRIKRMRQPFWSEFRLRVDDFRVYYDVDELAGYVNVLRILEKGTGETPKESP